jgi:hypothetical protein
MKKVSRVACLACLLAAGVCGADLQSGDSLVFAISSSSYANDAAGFGLAAYPGALDFIFMALPVSGGGEFTAELQSMDESASAKFPGPLGWTNGDLQSAAYTGPISALIDSIALPDALAQSIFAAGEAELILTNWGPDVSPGLPDADLTQDLWVNLSGGPLTIGGMVLDAGQNDDSDVAEVAEPEPGRLFAMGLGLYFLGWALRLRSGATTTARCG